jgi:hypothetical protein
MNQQQDGLSWPGDRATGFCATLRLLKIARPRSAELTRSSNGPSPMTGVTERR